MSEITITREQFRNAVKDAMEVWRAVPSADGDGEKNNFADFMMFLQNLTFGALIEQQLFGETDEENDKADENKEDN